MCDVSAKCAASKTLDKEVSPWTEERVIYYYQRTDIWTLKVASVDPERYFSVI